jgi:hypothetical protein
MNHTKSHTTAQARPVSDARPHSITQQTADTTQSANTAPEAMEEYGALLDRFHKPYLASRGDLDRVDFAGVARALSTYELEIIDYCCHAAMKTALKRFFPFDGDVDFEMTVLKSGWATHPTHMSRKRVELRVGNDKVVLGNDSRSGIEEPAHCFILLHAIVGAADAERERRQTVQGKEEII